MRQHTGKISPPSVRVPAPIRASIRRDLLSWYDERKRDLPWRRRTNDPYAQWVAEIMLQQTRVPTVIDYYETFLERFPTVIALAGATQEAVLKAWEGLGYYRRVLNLRTAAQSLVRTGASMPTTAAELRGLAGVGGYTAAAIASIAYGEPIAAVDGNVARVIARLFHVETDILSTKGRHQVSVLATRLLPHDRPGDFNQAWMDFASLVCTPRNPKCDACPLARRCVARKRGSVDRLPVRGAGRDPSVPIVDLIVGLFECDGRTLVRRRPVGGLWSGLWEPPTIELAGRVTVRSLPRLLRACDLTGDGAPVRLGDIEHRLTHRLLRLHAFTARVKRHARRATADTRWVTPRQLAALPVPIAHRKVFRMRSDAR